MKNEEFLDEQLIDMINQAEASQKDEKKKTQESGAQAADKNDEESKAGLGQGVKILGKTYCFERRLMADDTISVMVPTEFSPMSEEIANSKYPSTYRPETILTDQSGTVNLMFHYMEGDDGKTSVELLRNQVFGMMKRVNGSIKERETGMTHAGLNEIAYVEFTNNVMDGKLYNLMFYVDVKGKPLMGSFNCSTKEMKYWRDIAFEMVQSLEIPETAE